MNVALSSNGATASSSSYTGAAASGTNNGDRSGLHYGQNGTWHSSGPGFPQWLQIDFNGSKTTEYDWQGRLRKTYNMDGTYKEASFAGCGCAGGTVLTLTDEVGRRQKVYSDVLGRQWKTEVLNWNGTVYSTITNTFNARDQVTLVRQWAGPENGGGAYHDTTMSYDGYGRLQSKHVPEQDAGTATTWTYKPDDTVGTVTDARGASATYIYSNGRHLVNEIHYSAPGGTPTSNVTLGYDAAGNRSSMSDGSGSTAYQYNSLSQMTAETRAFTGLTGSFTLAYEYALSGAVKKITDQHEGTSFTASFNNSGRVSGVSAIQHGGGFVPYASQAQYRATGALNHVIVRFPEGSKRGLFASPNREKPTPLVTVHCHATNPHSLWHIFDELWRKYGK